MEPWINYISFQEEMSALFSTYRNISMLIVTEEISLIMNIHIQGIFNYFGKIIANKEVKRNYSYLKNSNKCSHTHLLSYLILNERSNEPIVSLSR